jgi:hypothetical protein
MESPLIGARNSRAAQKSVFLIAHDLVAKPLTLWRIMR